MSVNGALFAGVSGLKAESSALGVISNNISNANTVGYKAGSGDFSTLVTSTNGGGGGGFSPGGVIAQSIQHVDGQGLLQASTSNTDVGISGRGFFVVAPSLTAQGTVSSTTPRDYTRAGSFTLDKSGNLVNSSGFYLLGVPTDTKGNPLTPNPVVQNLQPVNVGTLTGIAKGTTELSVGANLPATPSTPSHLTVSGTLDGQTDFLDPTHYVMYSSPGTTSSTPSGKGGAPYDCQLMYKCTSQAGQPATYDIEVVNMTPIAGSPPLAATQKMPVTIGTVTITAGGGMVSGGQAVSFQDGSTLQPVLDATNLKLSTTEGNNVDRAAVDAQDIATTVYDSLGVASTMTLEMSRGSDVSRTASNPVNNISLAGTLDVTALSGTNVALPGTQIITASDGTQYEATLQIAVGSPTSSLQATALTPLGKSSLDPNLAYPVNIADLTITSTGTTMVAPAGTNTIDTGGTVSLSCALTNQTGLVDATGASTSGMDASNNTTYTVTAPTLNEWVTTIRDMRISSTGQSSVTFPLSTATGPAGAITRFPIYLNGTPATAMGTVNNASNFLALSGAFIASATPGTTSLGSSRVTTAQGNSYMAAMQVDDVTGDVSIASLTPIGNAPVAGGTFPLDLGTISAGTPTTFSSAGLSPFTTSGTDTLTVDVSATLGNLDTTVATSTSMTAQMDVESSSTGVPNTSVVSFNSDGTLKSGAPTTIPALKMTTGAATFGGASFTLNFGTPNTAGGLTQYTDQFAISFLNQDGVRFGFRTGVSFDSDGIVSAVFDNGQSIPLFKVPLVNFADPNQLQAISGDVYGQTTDSGDPVPNFPGVGGTGALTPSTLEASTVDLSTEFANLIITQRTFSADAKTITTSDQMLQELLTIKQ